MLPLGEKVLVLRTFWQLWRIRRALARRAFKSVLEDVRERAARGRWVLAASYIDCGLVCRWVEGCSWNLPGEYTCLPKAMAGFLLCAGYGYRTEIRFGVDRTDRGELDAHAWLEYEGDIVLGLLPRMERFKIFNWPDAFSQKKS